MTADAGSCASRTPSRPMRCAPVFFRIADIALGRHRTQRFFARGDESLRIRRDAHAIAVQRDHVGDRRADDGLSGRHVFERLGRADEARRLVERERHQAHVPRRHERRQFGIRLLPEIVDVRRLRQRGRIDLHDRPDIAELPLRPQRGDLAHELDVEALVDHAEEPEHRSAKRKRSSAMRRSRAAEKCATSTLLGKQCVCALRRVALRTGSARR